MKKVVKLLVALLMIMTLCACSKNESSDTVDVPSTDSELIKANGVLVVGITDFAPMDYKDANGEWIGFDADLAKAFAESLGVAVEFKEIDWDNKVLELNNKGIDCVWNGMTLTDAVMNAMETTKPYILNAQTVVTSADLAATIQSIDDVKDLVFAVEAGSAGQDTADEFGLEYTAVGAQADALNEVAASTSDVAIIDLTMAKAMTGAGTSYSNLEYSLVLNEEYYGVGFRKGSDLASMLDNFLASNKDLVKKVAVEYGQENSLVD